MLIEKEALLSKFDPDGRNLNPIEVRALIVQAPAVDAVPVVRCGECRMIMPATEKRPDYCPIMQNYPAKDFYCGAGERKDGEK